MPQHSDGDVWREWYLVNCERCGRSEDNEGVCWHEGPLVCGNCDAIVCTDCAHDHELECWQDTEAKGGT